MWLIVHAGSPSAKVYLTPEKSAMAMRIATGRTSGTCPIGIPLGCLLCKKDRPGRTYYFCAARVERMGYEVVHDDGAFLCHSCAKGHLGLNAFASAVDTLLFFLLGLLATAILARLNLRILALVAFVLTCRKLVRGLQRARAGVANSYLADAAATLALTRLAIRARRQAVLKAVGLPEARIIFLPREEHLARLKPATEDGRRAARHVLMNCGDPPGAARDEVLHAALEQVIRETDLSSSRPEAGSRR
jgi:hypothetical protein